MAAIRTLSAVTLYAGILFMGGVAPAGAVTLDVCPSGCSYDSIQAAIVAATDGVDDVLVGDGTYYENVDFLGKAIAVRSENGPAVTTIDGSLPADPNNNSVVVFMTGEGPGSILDGFTITNGTGRSSNFYGGGIYSSGSAPSIENCLVIGNSASSGGGIYGTSSGMAVTGTTVSGNYASNGGGMYVTGTSSVTLEDCTVELNTSSNNGGGIYYNASTGPQSLTLTGCTVSGNEAGLSGGGISTNGVFGTQQPLTIVSSTISSNSCLWGDGGGIEAGTLIMSGSTVEYNTSEFGGGGIAAGEGSSVTDSVIRNNLARYDGGGITIDGGTAGSEVLDCTVTGNSTEGNSTGSRGGGIYMQGNNITISGCYIAGNSVTIYESGGGGIYAGGEGTISDCTIEGNYGDKAGGVRIGWSSVTIEGSTIRNNHGAGVSIYGNLTDTPTLKDCLITGNLNPGDGGGVHSNSASPLIENCVISGNVAGEDGGGVHGKWSDMALVNSVISGNSAYQGGGIAFDSLVGSIVNTTIAANSADRSGGIYCYSSNMMVVNSLLGGNEATVNGEEISLSGSSPSMDMSYSITQDGDPDNGGAVWPGTGNMIADPLFVDPRPPSEAPAMAGNYGIKPLSPAIDSGTDDTVTYPLLPVDDFEGQARPQGAGYDIGADEHVFKGDWDADGKPDIFWRNYSSGGNYLWYMDGTAMTSGTPPPAVGDTDWIVASTADFDNDGKPDLLWRNTLTGTNFLWYMDGALYDAGEGVETMGTRWEPAGAADFDLDRKTDILWRDPATGQNEIWYMDGALRVGTAALPPAAAGWTVGGIDDFNGDGRSDILWRHGATGANFLWYLDGTEVTGAAALPSANAAWSIDGTADFNGDGKPDICWRNYTTGDNYLWYMDGPAQTGDDPLPGVAVTSWAIEE